MNKDDIFKIIAKAAAYVPDDYWSNEERKRIEAAVDEIWAGIPKWQPIETAPKDKTEIMVFCLWRNAVSLGDIHLAFWGETWSNSRRIYAWLETDSYDSRTETHLILRPTHWMPLPERPKQT